MRIRVSQEPKSLISSLDPDPVTRFIADHTIFQSLISASMDTPGVVPALATAWTVDAAHTRFEFTLNPAAQWHDGTPVTAADVAFTLARLVDPDGQIPLRQRFSHIDDVTVLDEHGIAVDLDAPRPGFLRQLAALPILPAHVFGNTPIARHPSIRRPIGSGPYTLAAWQPGVSIALDRAPTWAGPSPYFDRIEFLVIPEDRVAMHLFQRGDVDIVPDLPGYFQPPHDVQFITHRLPRTEAMVYNMSKPVFSRAAARTAMGLLIDRTAIRCSIHKCRADIATGPWPEHEILDPGMTKSPQPPLKKGAHMEAPFGEEEYLKSPFEKGGLGDFHFDPQRATDLLSRDGWTDRDGDGTRDRGGMAFSFELILPDHERGFQRTVAVIRDDLSRVGVEMRVATINHKTYLNRLQSGDFDAAMVAFDTGLLFDPWSMFHSDAHGSAQNYAGLHNPEIDRLLNALESVAVAPVRLDLYNKLNMLISSEHPMTFTFRPYSAVVAAQDIRGIAVTDGHLDVLTLRRDTSPPATPR